MKERVEWAGEFFAEDPPPQEPGGKYDWIVGLVFSICAVVLLFSFISTPRCSVYPNPPSLNFKVPIEFDKYPAGVRYQYYIYQYGVAVPTTPPQEGK